jgi:tRNA pseudouridine65 synthase
VSPPLEVLYLDDDVLVVQKPWGIAVHRGMDLDRDTVLARATALGLGRVAPAHRLDRPTSGALVLARHKDAARALAEAFGERRVHKTYLALARGLVPEHALVDYPVPLDEGGEKGSAQTDIVRLAVAVVQGSPLREPRYSLVRATPATGRFHQVRRHMSHLRHPIVGDTNYGRSEHNHFCAERFSLRRLALHAERIVFPHPRTQEPVEVAAPLPADLREPLLAMGFSL